jgi:competence ComEA-like helix-hairpin-helix protein
MTTIKRLFVIALLSCLGLPAFATTGQINVNKASAHTLMTKLSGVNRTLANRIVNYREKHGPFIGAYDLGYVNGVNRKFFMANDDRITVGKVNLGEKKHDPFDPNAKG